MYFVLYVFTRAVPHFVYLCPLKGPLSLLARPKRPVRGGGRPEGGVPKGFSFMKPKKFSATSCHRTLQLASMRRPQFTRTTTASRLLALREVVRFQTPFSFPARTTLLKLLLASLTKESTDCCKTYYLKVL